MTIDFEGAKEVLARLQKLPPAAIEAALDDAAASQETEVAIRFERGRDAQGNAWATLSKKTLKYRKGGGPPLTVTGDLSGSITRRVSAQGASVGTNYELAPFHQFGTSRGIPARPFIGWSSEGQAEVLDILRAHIARTVGAS
jgi:phage virion morphogenesis protein